MMKKLAFPFPLVRAQALLFLAPIAVLFAQARFASKRAPGGGKMMHAARTFLASFKRSEFVALPMFAAQVLLYLLHTNSYWVA